MSDVIKTREKTPTLGAPADRSAGSRVLCQGLLE